MMKLAFYKAQTGNLFDKAINIWTGLYGYSHVELVFSDGMCYTADFRNNVVRKKKIDLGSGHWETIDLDFNEQQESEIRKLAEEYIDKKYDYFGIVFWFVLPFRRQKSNRWWCSELCSFLLGERKFRISPNKMAKRHNLPRQPFDFMIRFMSKY